MMGKDKQMKCKCLNNKKWERIMPGKVSKTNIDYGVIFIMKGNIWQTPSQFSRLIERYHSLPERVIKCTFTKTVSRVLKGTAIHTGENFDYATYLLSVILQEICYVCGAGTPMNFEIHFSFIGP